ncbi:MAG: VOC family protein [Christensenellales bacterium]|jgi:predicted enzyme related to lactoylglutathione lyase
MGIRYLHTNIIAKDWRALAAFYIEVFGCEPVQPGGEPVDESDGQTGICGMRMTGARLKLPGSDAMLEILSCEPEGLDSWRPVNRPGLGHLAFYVDDIEQTLADITAHGGQQVSEVVRHTASEGGTLITAYACDPEGNGLELQNWCKK